MKNPNRKTNVRMMTTKSGQFATFEQATAFANALKMKLERLCKSNPGYSTVAIIGISQHKSGSGAMEMHGNGAKGRPARVFVPFSPDNDGLTAPHLHIIIVANPCETIRKELHDYCNRHFAKLGFGKNGNLHVEDDIFDINGLLEYVLKQSAAVRTVEVNPDGILNLTNDFGLHDTLQALKTTHNINFPTLEIIPRNTAEIVDTADHGFIFTTAAGDDFEEVPIIRGFLQNIPSQNISQCNKNLFARYDAKRKKFSVDAFHNKDP